MERLAADVFTSMRGMGSTVCRRCVYFAMSLAANDARRVPSLAGYFIPCMLDFVASVDLDLREGSLRLLVVFAQQQASRAALLEAHGGREGLVLELARRRRGVVYDSDEQR